jgi:1-phosphatidylinositol-3-phosphate 5-kinase
MGISSSTQGLESHSQHYLRQLLNQCLTRAGVGNKEEWMTILLPLAIRVIQSVKPDATSRGKKMGVRRLVKIKRIAGGKPQDSHAMDGYICSRNVASKAMVRRLPLRSARVALLSFSLTAVKGEGQYVSLDALTASEREYTRIMVARVLALRPHLLIVRDQVSRMALDMLEQAGIVVVWKVPESSMASIARVTQSDIVTSLDRLALQPRLGRCGVFAADTYHSMLLPGKRRSFLRFTGTPKELGCSIILRGGGQALLGKIKSILEFCLLAAHNLRLEESMRNVDLALLPEPRDADLETRAGGDDCEKPENPGVRSGEGEAGSTRQADANHNSVDAADAKVTAALQDYRSTLLSMSARLQIPPPYPLIRLRNEQAVLNDLKCELQSDKDAQRIEQLEVTSTHSPVLHNEKGLDGEAEKNGESRQQDQVTTAPREDSDEEAKTDDPVPAGDPSSDPAKQASLQAEAQPLALDEKMDVEKQVSAVLPSSATMSLQTRFAVARSRHAFDVKILPSLVDIGKEGLTPFCHQRLTVLHSFINSSTLKPCIGPRIEQMEFYGKEDHTLGDFLDSKCVGSSQVCKAKNCGLQQILHYDSYIHHQVRIQCFCERFVCPIAGQELSILTWEYCKGERSQNRDGHLRTQIG